MAIPRGKRNWGYWKRWDFARIPFSDVHGESLIEGGFARAVENKPISADRAETVE